MRIYGGASDLSERKAYVRTGKCIYAFTELDMMVHTRPIYKTKLGTLSNNSESNMWYTRDQFTDGIHGKNHKEDFSQKSIASCVDQHRTKSSGGASLCTAPGQNPGEEIYGNQRSVRISGETGDQSESLAKHWVSLQYRVCNLQWHPEARYKVLKRSPTCGTCNTVVWEASTLKSMAWLAPSCHTTNN